MEGEIRSTPGERLVKRMMTREHRRPRLGFAPEFYARFGLEDPWAFESKGGSEPDGDGFVYLSAAPYYAMMRRLAASRRRREKRLAEFTSRRAGTQLRAATRSWPGVSAMAVSRLSRLALDEMVLPPPIPDAVAAPDTDEEIVSEGGSRIRRRASRTRPSLFARPSLVAASSGGAEAAPRRAADHAGARIARAASASSDAARIVEHVSPVLSARRRDALVRVVETIEELPEAERAAEVRRVVRRIAALRPLGRAVLEDFAPEVNGSERPAEVARRRFSDAGRMAPSRSTGLRPALSRSPAMALAAAPDLDRAAAGTLAEAERTEGGRQLAAVPRRASSSQRASARASAGTTRAGSALPAALGLLGGGVVRAPLTRSIVQSPVARVALPTSRSEGPAAPAAERAERARATRRLPASSARGRASTTEREAEETIGHDPSFRPTRRVAPAGVTPVFAPGVFAPVEAAGTEVEAPVRRAARSLAVGTARAVARAIAAPSPSIARTPVAPSSTLPVATSEGRFVSARSASRHPAAEFLPELFVSGLGMSAPAAPRTDIEHARLELAGVDRAAAFTHASERGAIPDSTSLLPRLSLSAPTRTLAAQAAAAETPEPSVPRSPVAGPTARARAARRATSALSTGAFSLPAAASEPVRTESGGFVPAASAARGPGNRAPIVERAGTTRSANGEAPTAAPRIARRAASEPVAAFSGDVARARSTEHANARVTAPAISTTRAISSRNPGMTWAASRTEVAAESETTLTPKATPSRPVRAAARPVRTSPVATVPRGGKPSVFIAQARADAPAGRTFGRSDAGLRGPTQRRTEPVSDLSPLTRPSRAALGRPSLQTLVPSEPNVSAVGRGDGTEPRAYVTARTAPARAFRAMSVAAAERAGSSSILLTRTGEHALSLAREALSAASSLSTPAASTARFSRSGPMSFAQAQTTLLAALAESSPAAATAARARAARARTVARSAPGSTLASTAAVFVTPSSLMGAGTYAPSTPVRTPAGKWVGARTAVETGGFDIVANPAGRLFATPRRSAGIDGTAASRRASDPNLTPARAAAARAPVRTLATPSAAEETGAAQRSLSALPRRVSHAERLLNRTEVSTATAYRGAYQTPALATVQAATATDAATPITRGPAARAPIGTAAPTTRPAARSAVTPTYAQPVTTTPDAAPETSAARPVRAPFESRIMDLAEGRSDGGRGWVDRAEGGPRVHNVSSLFEALARATSAEQVADVIIARSEASREVPLDAPALQVIQQIQHEIRQEFITSEPEVIIRESRLAAPSTQMLQKGPVRSGSSSRGSRGATRAPSATARTAKGGSGADDRITKLVKKLEGLIHLAEVENRLADARRQVRMAEDSPGARAEGSGPVGQGHAGGAADQKKHDIEALGREVLDYVNKELELRRSRRMEDSDDSVGW